VIVHHFNIVSISVVPDKTDAVSVVDVDAVPAFPITAQSLQPVTGRHHEVFQPQRGVQDVQFLQTPPVKLGWQTLAPASRQSLSVSASRNPAIMPYDNAARLEMQGVLYKGSRVLADRQTVRGVLAAAKKLLAKCRGFVR
jgi:hypothetical protein